MDGSNARIALRWIALALCAAITAGCASWRAPQIDPSGEHIFLPPEAAVVTGVPELPGVSLRQESIALTPTEVVAPVGSEVVLLATFYGADGCPVAGRRVEWMLSQNGVGQFVTLGERDELFALRMPRNKPRKVDNHFAIGTTSSSTFNITRGTPGAEDDITVLRGQAWVSVSSPIEGTSVVTSFAPEIVPWDRRQAMGRIHWVDAQWIFPPPAVNPVGTPHVFTTTVTRASDGSPLAGYTVRYEMVGGPPAGFAPDGAEAIDVTTDENGQARVEVFQRDPQPGTSRVGIQIIRPASETSRRLVLGTGVTAKTWTTPDLALRTTGPAAASIGATAVYRIDVSNPGDLPTGEITVTSDMPDGLTYTSSNPPAEVAGRTLTWQLARLEARQTHMIEVEYRVDAAGTVNHCAQARTAEGLSARDCATTTIAAPQSLDVQMTGPETARVGDTVRYEVVVTNRGQMPLTGLVIRDTFDDGLQHLVDSSPIERDLNDLQPGESQRIAITFQVVREGRHCHVVEVTGPGALRSSAQACVTAGPADVQQPRAAPPTTTPEAEPGRRGQPAMEVVKTGPKQVRVNDKVLFVTKIKNTGEVPLTNLVIVDTADRTLDPLRAEQGYTRGQDDGLVWRIDRLDVGQTREIRVEMLAMAPAKNACNWVTVQSDQVPQMAHQACVEILPARDSAEQPNAGQGAAPGLRLTMQDLADPATVGAQIEYRVYIANPGTTSARGVQLTVTFPPGLTPLVTGTKGPSRHTIDGQTVRFDPVAEVRPGETLVPYSIPVQAAQVGRFNVSARLAAAGLQQPLTVEELTEIVE